MPRTRQLKPGFFMDEDVACLGFPTRLLFQGLWTLADRKGRLPDRPAWIRAQVFPYDDLEAQGLSVGTMLDELAQPRTHRPGGFIVRYVVDGIAYIQVRNFERHQHPHPKEVASEIPAPQPDTEKPRPSRGKQRPSNGRAVEVPGDAVDEPRPSPAVPSVPSGSSEPSGSGAIAPVAASGVEPPPTAATPAEAKQRALAVLGKPERRTWLTPPCEAWKARWGEESRPPTGEMERHFAKPYHEFKARGEVDELWARWERFLAATERSEWARPLRFVEGLGQWASDRPPPRAGPAGKGSVGERQLAAAREFIGGGKGGGG